MDNIIEALSNTADGCLAIDRDQRIIFCNSAAVRLLSVKEQDVIGEPCYQVLRGRDETGDAVCRWNCETVKMARRKKLAPTRDICVHCTVDQPVWLSVSTILMPSEQRERSILIHFFHDVSRQKRVERDAQNLVASMDRLRATQIGCFSQIHDGAPLAVDLTRRELEVLRLLASGASTDLTARRLKISKATVRNHIQSILSKLGAHTRLEAVTLAMRKNILEGT